MNTVGVHLLKHINTLAVYWNALGTTAVAIAVLAAAPSHQSAHFVFTGFVDGTGVVQQDGSSVGWATRASVAYVAIIGILIAQYSLTGFDASAHVRHFTPLLLLSAKILRITLILLPVDD